MDLREQRTWLLCQYAQATARLAQLEADNAVLVEAIREARPYIAKMVADGVQTAQPPSLVLRKIDRILNEVDV